LRAWRGWEKHPLPPELTPATLDRIEAQLVASLTPANPREIGLQLELLRAHYGEWGGGRPDLVKALARQWLEDCADVPSHLLELACRRWRLEQDPPAKRAPHTAGELLALIREDWSKLKYLGYQLIAARKAIAGPPPPSNDDGPVALDDVRKLARSLRRTG
jgi:hypothetical protein